METSQKLRRVSSLMLRDSSTSTIGKRTWIMLCHSAAYLRFSFSLLMSFKIHLSADTAKSTGIKTNQRSLPLVYIYMNNKLDNSPKQGPSFPPQKKYNSVILSHPLSLVGEQRQVLQNLPTLHHCYATGSIPSLGRWLGFPCSQFCRAFNTRANSKWPQMVLKGWVRRFEDEKNWQRFWLFNSG